MSYVDVTMAHWMNWMPHAISHTPEMAPYPKLRALVERMETVPGYANWLKTRPQNNAKMYP